MEDFDLSLPLPEGGAVWLELYKSRLTTELYKIKGLRPGTKRGDAVLAVAVQIAEELLTAIDRSLQNKDSSFRLELDAANASVQVLERQLQTCSLQILEYHKTKNHGFLRTALHALGAVALAVSSGVAGGLAEGVVTGSQPSTGVAIVGPAPQTFAELALACGALDRAVDDLKGYDDTEPDTAEADGSDYQDAEDEDWDDWPRHFDDDGWFESQDQQGGFVFPDGDPTEGAVWRSAGFSVEMAHEWMLVGMTLESAKAWSAVGFDPFSADSWARQKFDPGEAADWSADDFEPGEARDWRLAGLKSAQARQWQSFDFEPFEVERWIGAGFDDPEEAAEWSSRYDSPAEAAAQRDNQLFDG